MSRPVLITLYAAGFICEFLGVALVAREIAHDIASARRFAGKRDPRNDPALGNTNFDVARQEMDTFRSFVLDRLTGGIATRVVGLVLVLVGAIIQLGANISAL